MKTASSMMGVDKTMHPASSAAQESHNTNSYDQNEFWDAFLPDIQNAKAQIIISSPFFTTRRIKLLAKELANLTSRGVVVCLFVQSPGSKYPGSQQEEIDFAIEREESNSALRVLQMLKVHVTFLKRIHEKFALIDDDILWEGSLNIMSHYNTHEHMRRWMSKKEAAAVRKKYQLNMCAQCVSNAANCVPRNEGSASGAGDLLSMRRRELGISQRQLGEKCGITQSRVWQIEAGANLSFCRLKMITEQLELGVVLVPNLFVPAVAEFIRRMENGVER